jgi:hypothetical protein
MGLLPRNFGQRRRKTPSATDTDLSIRASWPNLTIPIGEIMLERLVDEAEVPEFIGVSNLSTVVPRVAVARPTASLSQGLP